MSKVVTDRAGKDTLDVIGSANQFNEWMYQTILPFASGKILEIGSGLGNISTFFLDNGNEIMLTDLRTEYCESLRLKFESKPNLLGVDHLDLVKPDFESAYQDHLGKYDTVFALNVIEHIQEDVLAIKNCKMLLKNGGHLIILVPSYQGLYNKFDKELGHFKRYTTNGLSNLFLKNQLFLVHKQYFNLMGILGWYVSGNILKKETIPASQMKIYDKLVPIWKLLDGLVQNNVGLSTICVGRK